MRRRFNDRERVALFLAQDGRCAICGAVLEPGWEADHIVAWSQGGRTALVNGQALCRRCNRQKGRRVMAEVAGTVTLRTWQEQALGRVESCTEVDFLCAATPGAGKTAFAISAWQSTRVIRRCEQLVIVAPTRHLCNQWREEAHKRGVQLSAEFRNADGDYGRDMDGVVTTYQSVAANPLVWQRLLLKRRAMVIFDEIHHAGAHPKLRWGNKLRQAFTSAAFRLAMTGTPFRSDSAAIPFVRYVEGKCLADFSYSYKDALRDDICRAVYFPSYEGRMTFHDVREGEQTVSFADDLDEQGESRRLRTALAADGDWIRQVLQEADVKLLEERLLNPHAGGLVIADNKAVAEEYCALLQRITLETPVLATSDIPDASERITAFSAHGYGPRWLVAVRMVSEGVDIPRLSVVVYASAVTTELFFRQVVGRTVRRVRGYPELDAYVFVPADERLKAHIDAIREERDHVIVEWPDDEPDEGTDDVIDLPPPPDPPPPPPPPAPRSLWWPESSEAIADDVIGLDGPLAAENIQLAREAQAANPNLRIGTEKLAEVIAGLREKGYITDPRGRDTGASPGMPASPSVPVEVKNLALRKRLHRLVGKYCVLSGLEHRIVYAEINEVLGVPGIKRATTGQLDHAIEIVKEWTRSYEQGSV